MRTTPHDDAGVAAVAQLLADRARATMLFALSDGRALPAGELARVARVAPATASAHLARLVAANILAVEQEGRHRYYRLANPSIVDALEALAAAAPAAPVARAAPGAGAPALSGVRLARTCYDHLAGALGVRITDALVGNGWIVLGRRAYEVTPAGHERFGALGIDVADVRGRAAGTRRAFTRACLDWSERRYHLAGALGAALCARLIDIGWVERLPATRAVRVSNAGRRALRRHLGVTLY